MNRIKQSQASKSDQKTPNPMPCPTSAAQASNKDKLTGCNETANVESRAPDRPPRIMLVDDEENIRFVLNCILVENGYSITEADSGRSFREAMLHPAPEVVLLDLKLPDANGLELLKLIRQEWPATEAIILTGFGSIETALNAVKLGAYDYLQKPLDCKKLITTIQRALERRRLKIESERHRREKIERQRQLDLLRSTAISSNRSASISEVADTTLKQFCEFLGWPVGHLSLFTPIFDAHPGSSSYWSLSPNRNFSVFCRVTDDGSTNLFTDWIAQRGEAVDVKWSEDVSKEPGFLRWHAARACGLKKGLTAPIVCSGTVVGALEFYAGAVPPPTHPQLVAAAQVAAQVACVLEREATQSALQQTRAELATEVLNQNSALKKMRDSLNREIHRQLVLLESVEFETRAPISDILNSAKDLKKSSQEQSSDNQASHIERILNQSFRLRHLIEDVTDLRRIESGHTELSVAPIDVRDLCKNVVATVRELAASKNINLSLHDIDAPATIKGDEKRLAQLLAHLLINAIKFTPRRGKVSLKALRSTERNAVAFVVNDSGVGVRETDQERIYEPFVRLDCSEGGETPGSGLGLALAEQIAQLHGGSIQLESRPNEGSKFSLVLPCESNN